MESYEQDFSQQDSTDRRDAKVSPQGVCDNLINAHECSCKPGAQALDMSGIWVTCHDSRSEVVAATATLYMCVKFHDNPMERVGVDGQLPANVDGATSFLERATNDNELVLSKTMFFVKRVVFCTR